MVGGGGRESHVTRGGYTTGNCQYSETTYARTQCKPMEASDLNSPGPGVARKVEFLLEVILKDGFLEEQGLGVR